MVSAYTLRTENYPLAQKLPGRFNTKLVRYTVLGHMGKAPMEIAHEKSKEEPTFATVLQSVHRVRLSIYTYIHTGLNRLGRMEVRLLIIILPTMES